MRQTNHLLFRTHLKLNLAKHKRIDDALSSAVRIPDMANGYDLGSCLRPGG